jgi:hypothetical protein
MLQCTKSIMVLFLIDDMRGPMRSKKKLSGPLPPIRVRCEPPSITEALIAARGLTTDADEQVEIAAALMNLSADEVRPHLQNMPPDQPPTAKPTPRRGPARPVIVERKFERVSLRRPQQPRQ